MSNGVALVQVGDYTINLANITYYVKVQPGEGDPRTRVFFVGRDEALTLAGALETAFHAAMHAHIIVTRPSYS
jgi:hypothetical protein